VAIYDKCVARGNGFVWDTLCKSTSVKTAPKIVANVGKIVATAQMEKRGWNGTIAPNLWQFLSRTKPEIVTISDKLLTSAWHVEQGSYGTISNF